jgi:hypothetical protein
MLDIYNFWRAYLCSRQLCYKLYYQILPKSQEFDWMKLLALNVDKTQSTPKIRTSEVNNIDKSGVELKINDKSGHLQRFSFRL